MHTPDERAAMIANIRALHDQLAAVVAGWSDNQLDYRPAPSEWCARQVIHHVADSHMNAFIRMKLALTQHNPTITPYDQDLWAELVDSVTLPVELSLGIVRGLHERWVVLWESLSDDDYQRPYLHPESGKLVSMDEHLATYSRHGLAHVEQIARIGREQGW
jgi:hypothetical protein